MGPGEYGWARREGAEALAETILEDEVMRWGCGVGGARGLRFGPQGMTRKWPGSGGVRSPWCLLVVSAVAGRLVMGVRGRLNHSMHGRRETSGRICETEELTPNRKA